MPCFVYILKSQKSDRYYIGQTQNVGERLTRHNSGLEKSTAPFLPWVLVWYTEKNDRSQAMALERKLKNL